MQLTTILTALFATAVLAHPAPGKDTDANTEIFGGPPNSETHYDGVRSHLSCHLFAMNTSQLTQSRNAAVRTEDVSSKAQNTGAHLVEYALPGRSQTCHWDEYLFANAHAAVIVQRSRPQMLHRHLQRWKQARIGVHLVLTSEDARGGVRSVDRQRWLWCVIRPGLASAFSIRRVDGSVLGARGG